MTALNALETKLYEWASKEVEGTDTKVIFSNQNAPKPDARFVLLNIISLTPEGLSEYKFGDLQINLSVDISFSNLMRAFVSVNVFYEGAYELAFRLRDSLETILIQEQFFTAGLGFINTTSVRYLPVEEKKLWVDRAQFDCSFYLRSGYINNLETIQKIELNDKIIQKP